MSNLLKFNMVQCDGDKKVIDYNELIADKLSKIQETAPLEVLEAQEGFRAGIMAEEVEIMPEEEPVSEPDPVQVVEEAREEARIIIEEANTQAEQLRKQAYQEGSKKGYDSGYAQAVADLENEKAKLQEEKRHFMQEYQKQLNEMEPMLVDAISTVVQEVFKIKFEDNRNLIVHLIRNTLGHIESSKEYYVKVSKSDYPYVMKYKEVIEKSVSKAAAIEVMEDGTLGKNQCLIETDGGVFDCSLDVQMDNLIKTLKMLSLS